MLEDGLDVQAVGVVGSNIVLGNTNNLGTNWVQRKSETWTCEYKHTRRNRKAAKPDTTNNKKASLALPVVLKELGSPVTDVSESLDNDGLAGNVTVEARQLLDLGVLQELADTVVDTETGGLVTATDTSLGDGLASDTSSGVDVLGVELAVGVHDPGHLAGTGSNIGSGDIDTGSDEVLLAELHGVATGDLLQLSGGELLGVELDTSLGTTEGNIDDSALEGHEGGQGLDLLKIDLIRETDTSLGGKAMAGVLGTVTLNDDVGVIVNLDGELDAEDRVDGLDGRQGLLGDTAELGGL